MTSSFPKSIVTKRTLYAALIVGNFHWNTIDSIDSIVPFCALSCSVLYLCACVFSCLDIFLATKRVCVYTHTYITYDSCAFASLVYTCRRLCLSSFVCFDVEYLAPAREHTTVDFISPVRSFSKIDLSVGVPILVFSQSLCIPCVLWCCSFLVFELVRFKILKG